MSEPTVVPNDPRLLRRVVVRDLKEYGNVRRVRIDDRGDPIFIVFMDNPRATADGIMYARETELIWL